MYCNELVIVWKPLGKVSNLFELLPGSRPTTGNTILGNGKKSTKTQSLVKKTTFASSNLKAFPFPNVQYNQRCWQFNKYWTDGRELLVSCHWINQSAPARLRRSDRFFVVVLINVDIRLNYVPICLPELTSNANGLLGPITAITNLIKLWRVHIFEELSLEVFGQPFFSIQ